MAEKIKTDVDRLLLVLKMQKSSVSEKFIGKFVFTVQTKRSLSTSVFIYPVIFQILTTNVYGFWT